MELQFCGATRMVTGACYFLDTGANKVLVDCGMFQGKEFRDNNTAPFPFDPGQIDYVFLTHAHIDHCGRLPVLVKQGFHGRIIATRATKDLVRILLSDSAHVQREERERCEDKGYTDCFSRQLYTPEEAEDVMQYFDTYPYGDTVKLGDRLEFRMRDAGHILGSAIFELWVKSNQGLTRKIVFSGDLGQPGQRIVKDPDLIREADYVVMESTYGNRLHRSKDETVLELLAILKQARKDQSTVLIPTFAVERAQELLYEMNLFVENKLIDGLDVYFDSPLAQKATEIFRRYSDIYDVDARRLVDGGDDPFGFDGLHYVASAAESQRLAGKTGIVILAGSGMCNGGRIVAHLEHHVSNPKSHLVFAGFQVKGTRGREIIDGAETIRLRGRELPVQMQVHTLGGFSAHGDQHDLEYWLQGFGKYPRKVYLVHGDSEVLDFFSAYLKKNLDLPIEVPDMNETVSLD